ncbi:unnamed protein product [Nippostrongylus brasiliensis]|uniref:DUF725 domain-containing protein n=1 Tax=Nippostrongylus brasiliensis TaxID=27835 RepID=A0A0N4XC80_NIPBR|nr:unnamed protein product [Nippostrongylus brasiliensis]
MNGLQRLLLICLVPTIASHCPSHVSSQIQECVRPVAEYAKLLNSDQDSSRSSPSEGLGSAFSLPNMGRKVFNGLCKLIAKFNVCVREYRMQCLRHVTISIIDSSYGYLCNEGYNILKDTTNTLMPGCQFTGASARLRPTESEETTLLTTAAPPTTTTAMITRALTTTMADFFVGEFVSKENPVLSRKGSRKNIVSGELAQLSTGSSTAHVVSVSMLLIVIIL